MPHNPDLGQQEIGTRLRGRHPCNPSPRLTASTDCLINKRTRSQKSAHRKSSRVRLAFSRCMCAFCRPQSRRDLPRAPDIITMQVDRRRRDRRESQIVAHGREFRPVGERMRCMRVPHPVRTRSAQLAGQERIIGGDQVRDFPVTRSQCSPRASLSMWPSIAPTSSLTRKPVAKPKSSRKRSLWAAGADQPYDHSSRRRSSEPAAIRLL